jgi:hypothetical protein
MQQVHPKNLANNIWLPLGSILMRRRIFVKAFKIMFEFKNVAQWVSILLKYEAN